MEIDDDGPDPERGLSAQQVAARIAAGLVNTAPPGTYRIRVEPVGPQIAKFITGGHRIDHGPAHWVDINTLEIRP
jgi:hypothetical protein